MENNKSKNLFLRLKQLSKKTKIIVAFVLVFVLAGGGYFIYFSNQYIYSDKAEIYAPLINISPSQPSVLQKIMVKD